jgi:hypothetical protein
MKPIVNYLLGGVTKLVTKYVLSLDEEQKDKLIDAMGYVIEKAAEGVTKGAIDEI